MQVGMWPAADREWVRALPERLGPRRLRLLAGAWCRALVERELAAAAGDDYGLARVGRVLREALDASDAYADTGRSKAALGRAAQRLEELGNSGDAPRFRSPVLLTLRVLLTRDPADSLPQCARALMMARQLPLEKLAPELRRLAEDLCPPDAAGRPAPPAAALELAGAIYQDRRFERMPELAAALEAAGCADGALLEHCRAPGAAHARGCWALDALLGERIARPARPAAAPRGTLPRHRLLDRELPQPPAATLELLRHAEQSLRPYLTPGAKNQRFARQANLDDSLAFLVMEHLGYGPIDALAERARQAVDRAVEYFLGDWWRGSEADARALDRDRPDRELEWYQALPNALLLCALADRWEDAARICDWFDERLQLEVRFELDDYEYQWLYLCIVSHLRPEPMPGLDVPRVLAALRSSRPKRPRLLGALWETVLAGDQARFDAALAASVRHFLPSPRPVSNVNFWVAREESLMWLAAERAGLGFPDLPEKLEAAVVRRQTTGLA